MGFAMDIERQLAVLDLNARYAEAIDEGRFEEWPDFFTDDGKYRVTTAENLEQNLPLSLIYATSRAMLRDRVKALREAKVHTSWLSPDETYEQAVTRFIDAALDASGGMNVYRRDDDAQEEVTNFGSERRRHLSSSAHQKLSPGR